MWGVARKSRRKSERLEGVDAARAVQTDVEMSVTGQVTVEGDRLEVQGGAQRRSSRRYRQGQVAVSASTASLSNGSLMRAGRASMYAITIPTSWSMFVVAGPLLHMVRLRSSFRGGNSCSACVTKAIPLTVPTQRP
jgi:hypothetical protein